MLRLFHFEDRGGANHPMGLVLHLIRFVLFIFLLTILDILFDALHDVASILVSLFDLFGLRLEVIGAEVSPFPELVDVGDLFFGEEQFGKVLEDGLDIFVVEPKNCSLGCFNVLNHPNTQCILAVLLETVLFSHYDLLVSQPALVRILLVPQLFLIVGDNLELFG